MRSCAWYCWSGYWHVHAGCIQLATHTVDSLCWLTHCGFTMLANTGDLVCGSSGGCTMLAKTRLATSSSRTSEISYKTCIINVQVHLDTWLSQPKLSQDSQSPYNVLQWCSQQRWNDNLTVCRKEITGFLPRLVPLTAYRPYRLQGGALSNRLAIAETINMPGHVLDVLMCNGMQQMQHVIIYAVPDTLWQLIWRVWRIDLLHSWVFWHHGMDRNIL